MKKRIALILLVVLMLCYPVAALAAAQSTPSGMPLSELEQFLDDYAAEHVGTTIAGASVIVIQRGETLLHRSYGYADIGSGTLVDEDTIFEWASVGKLLVWTSVMQLYEQGYLDLNTDIRGYLPEGTLRRLRFDSPITMYNLMHHNAGWGMRATDLFNRSPIQVISLEESIRRFEPNQMFAPGEVVSYSNYGVALAGYIVECISGQPFYEYVNENIFSVLGMADTTTHPYQADNPSISDRRDQTIGYVSGAGRVVPAPLSRAYFSLYPAGSAMGTITDMAKFLSALMPTEGERSPLFNNNATLYEMLSISYFYGEGIPGIAHGFFEEFYAVRTLGHVGSLMNAASRFTFSPEHEFGLIVLTNTDNQNFGAGIERALFGNAYTETYTGELPNVYNLNNLAGQYSSAMRHENRGFMYLFGSIPASRERIQIIDENTLSFNEMEFVQIRPYVFLDDTASFQLHLIVENNNVARVLLSSDVAGMVTAGAVLEYTPVAGNRVFAVYVSLILLAVCAIYVFYSGVSTTIKCAQYRKKNKKQGLSKKTPFVLKITAARDLFGAVVFINFLVLFVRANMLATPYRLLMPHFILNIAYLLFVPVCSVLIVINLKKAALEKIDRVFCFISFIAALIFALLLLLWEFYR